MSVAVIGSGVIGLTTGLELQKRGYEVSIYTKKAAKETDSNAACAIWLPFSGGPKTDVPEREKEWVRRSWNEFKRIDNKSETESVLEKVELIECIDKPFRDKPYFSKIVDHFETGTVEGPSGEISCWKMDTYVVEMPEYMPYLESEFLKKGGEIIEKSIHREDIPQLTESIVFNCAGIGAKELFNDENLKPVKGEVLLHDQVDIDQAIGDGKFCIIPRTDALVIGSQWKEGVKKRKHDKEWANKTIDRADEWAKSPVGKELKLDDNYDSKKIKDFVTGVRPQRDQVRIEREEIDETVVYHNYGHGGSGVTLSWGCAIDVADRFEQDAVEHLNQINQVRSGSSVADLSIEVAHADMPVDDENFDKVISESIVEAKEVMNSLDDDITYVFVVLIDDDAVESDRETVKNIILESTEGEIQIDYICYESELEKLLPNIKQKLSDETLDRWQGYIGNHGETGCSHDVVIWYCLRLGLIDGVSDIAIPVSKQAKADEIPFVSNKNMSILREGVTQPEEWAAEYLNESFCAEVVAVARNNKYYSTDD